MTHLFMLKAPPHTARSTALSGEFDLPLARIGRRTALGSTMLLISTMHTSKALDVLAEGL